ncbi:phosphodiesterase [Aurantimonas sp. C2-6-R+9]|uniref:putative bifunctional diguanylate cyclase/phosphodiesterase n=1 Tax=unclassified Aurantimonas TaxID=2638230 RepID=UPI002E17FCF2|nr:MULTISPECIES: phosphodiesterase [unclassified Aurantimonas]MEC5292947.1 phosphodiesterase [Aurantimonas sp. C2-3-R2]MEC5383497.1 phosphodiesterase [Aurantimonas sp. C2-6-R+9]
MIFHHTLQSPRLLELARGGISGWTDIPHVRNSLRLIVGVITIATLLALAAGFVWATGGTKLAYVHSLYVPILVAAFLFGLPAGAATGLVAGLLVGPLMPLDVDAGTFQDAANWTVQMGFFTFIGALAGALWSALMLQLNTARHLSRHDLMTGLPNRQSLLDHVDAKIQSDRRTDGTFAILSIKLRHVDRTAASLGYAQTNALLTGTASRLKEVLSNEAMLYDLGYGAFAAVVPSAVWDDAPRLCRMILDVLHSPFATDATPMLAGGNVGISSYPSHGKTALDLLRSATAALQEAIDAGEPYAVYDDEKDRKYRSISRLLPDLQAALAKPEQIALQFQPKVDLSTGICVGVEALARWKHPELGIVSPGDFIPLAEETALIKPLTERILDASLAAASAWRRDGLVLPVAINVSIRNLEDPSFLGTFKNLVKRHEVPPSQLELEITETALATMPSAIISVLGELRQLGVRIALDDFGTGHCSLTYLRDLPADTLKLDRSFMDSLLSDQKTQIIVAAVIQTAHALGFQVVAEGIENEQTYGKVRDLSCDKGQGFYIARPLWGCDVRDWISQNRLVQV